MFTFFKSVPGRALRFLVGFLLVVAGAYFHPLIALVLIALGSVMAVESLAGECWLETLVKARTAKTPAGAHAPLLQ
jgi:hypothetical protein